MHGHPGRRGIRVARLRDTLARMRIALVTESFFPAVDGTTTTVKAVADRLVDTGHEVLVVAPGPGLDVLPRLPGRPDPARWSRSGRQVRAALEAFGPTWSTSPRRARSGRKALKHAGRHGIPTVVVEQSPVLDVAADYWRAKVADRADAVLVTSSLDGRPDGRVRRDAPSCGRPGVDTAAFTPALRDQWLHDTWARARSADGPRVVVGYVGGLHKRHGVRRLAELAAVPGIRPVVIGDGPQRDWLRGPAAGRQAHRAAADRRPDRRAAEPRRAGAPGEHETCCHALREAAASGVPVVAPRVGRRARRRPPPRDRPALRPGATPADLRRAVAAVVADRHRALLGERGPRARAAAHLDRRGRRAASREHYPRALDAVARTRPDDGLGNRTYLTRPRASGRPRQR